MNPMATSTETRPQPSKPRRCPRCSLISPGSALHCDCGFDFRAAPSEVRDEIENQAHAATGQIAAGVGLMVLGGIAMAVIKMVSGRSIVLVTMALVLGNVLIVTGIRRRIALARQMRAEGAEEDAGTSG